MLTAHLAKLQFQCIRVDHEIRFLRFTQIIHGLIYRISTAGGGIIDGDNEIEVVDYTRQRLFHGIRIVRMGHGAQMGTLLQQGKIPVTKFWRPFCCDFLMGQDALQEQGGIVVAKQVENFSRPKSGAGIGDDIEAVVSRLTEQLNLL